MSIRLQKSKKKLSKKSGSKSLWILYEYTFAQQSWAIICLYKNNVKNLNYLSGGSVVFVIMALLFYCFLPIVLKDKFFATGQTKAVVLKTRIHIKRT